jgi:gamma-glutamyl-gamma-aminobutyrate hydrolase PuuD
MSNKILVLHGESYCSPVRGLGEIITEREEFLRNPEDFKLVLFTGGEDISPELYNDTSPSNVCHNSVERDRLEIEVFETALRNNIFMTGICRGLQFLNVMHGGKMMHHLNNHESGRHEVRTATGFNIITNSLHHQMILPTTDARVVAWSSENLSNVYIGRGDDFVDYIGVEVEAAVFPEIRAFGVQWHPELHWESDPGYFIYRRMLVDVLNIPWSEFVNKQIGVRDVLSSSSTTS